jgi:hypothetical protein
MARITTSAAHRARSTLDRRSTQLFSQDTDDDSQTQPQLETQGKESELQDAFNGADSSANATTRVAFTDFFSFTNDEEDQQLRDLDDGLDAAKYQKTVSANPQVMFSLLGELMGQARSAILDRDTLLEANEINKGKYEDLRTKLAQATKTATELQALMDPNDQHPHEIARLQERAQKFEKHANEYRGLKKDLEAQAVQYKVQIADQADQIRDLNDQVLLIDDLKKEISDLKAAAAGSRGRTRTRAPRSSMSRSLSRARRGGTAPSKSRSRVPSSKSPSPYVNRGRSREATAATDQSVTTHSVTINPAQTKGIDAGRNIPNPSKFDGTASNFYPWMTGIELKLQEVSFRTEVDGMKYVQGFLTGPA